MSSFLGAHIWRFEIDGFVRSVAGNQYLAVDICVRPVNIYRDAGP